MPTQYRLYGRQFYRSKDPTNSIKVLKEKATKEIQENTNNKIHIYTGFLGYIHCNFCLNLHITRGDMKENVSGCFFSEHSAHIQ